MPLQRTTFRWSDRLLAVVPWPTTTLLLAGYLVGFGLSFFPQVMQVTRFVPADWASGEVWRIVTGRFIQPTPLWYFVPFILLLALVAREIEVRLGGWGLASLWILASLFIFSLWIAVQWLAHWVDWQSGWRIPMTGYPTATALIVYRATQAPLTPVVGTAGYLNHAQLLVLYLALTSMNSFRGAWPIELSAHAIGAVFGLVAARWHRARWDRNVGLAKRTQHNREDKAGDAKGVAADQRIPATQLSEQELDASVDRLLEKISRMGQDALNIHDRRVLNEASRRQKKRR